MRTDSRTENESGNIGIPGQGSAGTATLDPARGDRLTFADEGPTVGSRHIQMVTGLLATLPPVDQQYVAKIVNELAAKHEFEYKAQRQPGSSTFGGYTPQNVEQLFTAQPWNADQHETGNRIREACIYVAKTMVRELPVTPLQQRAIGLIHEAQMVANLANTWRGQL